MIGGAELKQAEVGEEPMKFERDGINPAAKPSGTACFGMRAMQVNTADQEPVLIPVELQVLVCVHAVGVPPQNCFGTPMTRTKSGATRMRTPFI